MDHQDTFLTPISYKKNIDGTINVIMIIALHILTDVLE